MRAARNGCRAAHPSNAERLRLFCITLLTNSRRALVREEVAFPFRFSLWATLLWLMADAGLLKPSIRALQSGTSHLVVGLSLLTGLAASAGPQAVVSFGAGTFSFWISEGCTAWAAALLYCSAVLAYPARWRQRGFGVLIGLPLVFALNVVRLVSMAWLGVRWPSLYEQAHGLWWQALVILAIGLGWLVWARYAEAQQRGIKAAGRVREVGVAVAIFLAVVAALEFGAAWTGAIHAYGSLVDEVSTGLSRLLFGARGEFFWPPGSLEFEHSLLFGALAGIAGLYLATPRVPVRTRLLGLAAFGLPAQFVLDSLGLAIRQAVLVDEIQRTYDAYLFGRILAWGGAVVVWCLFARRQWLRVLDRREPIACPSCHEAPDDLFGHLADKHRPEARRLRKRLVVRHPELRQEWHRLQNGGQQNRQAPAADPTADQRHS